MEWNVKVSSYFKCTCFQKENAVILSKYGKSKKPRESANLGVFMENYEGVTPYLLSKYLYSNISGLTPSSREGEEFFS